MQNFLLFLNLYNLYHLIFICLKAKQKEKKSKKIELYLVESLPPGSHQSSCFRQKFQQKFPLQNFVKSFPFYFSTVFKIEIKICLKRAGDCSLSFGLQARYLETATAFRMISGLYRSDSSFVYDAPIPQRFV